MTNSDERARGQADVKKSPSHGSHRITPPQAVRQAVNMEVDEPWSWFWHADSERFFLRRAGAQLDGIPEDVDLFGVAEARRNSNGKYMDFAIPPEAVKTLGIDKGDTYEFVAIDSNTMHMIYIPTDD